MSKHIVVALALASLAATLACHRNRAPRTTSSSPGDGRWDQNGNGTGYADPNAPPPGPVGAPVAAGSCDGACVHYLQCKGNTDPSAQPACVTKCTQMNLTAKQLYDYERTDCVTAIYQAENSGGANTGGGTAKPKSSECQGCVWDGSSCIWLSQSNWGAGPYSGAYSSCKTYCCPGH